MKIVRGIFSRARHLLSRRLSPGRISSEGATTNASPDAREIDVEYCLTDALRRFATASRLYDYMDHYFHHRAPRVLREHRDYFRQDRRGYGEDAMHAMWWLLFLEFRPRKCLEIGVYRGQVISLWTLLGNVLHIAVDVVGISPLSSVGDSVSSAYLDIDYLEDIRRHFHHFGLGEPNLCKALSTSDAARRTVSSGSWDLIYIDGSHDYDVVSQDYEMCRDALAPRGIIVFDDAAAELDYVPRNGSFAGHPGPSRLVNERVRHEMTYLGHVGHNVIFQKP